MPDLTVSADIDAFMASANDAAARTELGLTALATTTPGTGVATFLATPSSANLAAALTDKTGTGVAVFGISPAFTTSVTTGSTTFAIFNTTATTINAFGAATALNIGAGAATVLNFGGFTSAAELRFLEPSGSGTNYSGFKQPAIAASITYSLPSDAPSNGDVLTSQSDGTLSWEPQSGAANAVTAASAAAGAGLLWTSGGADRTAVATDTVTTINATNSNVDVLKIMDAVDQSHGLSFVVSSNLAADKTFTYTGAFNFTMTLSADTSVTFPVSGTLYSSGTTDVAVADGGTGLSSGTSGGVLGFTAAGTIASSAALAANAIVIGGGAGATPTTTTTGTGVLTQLGLAADGSDVDAIGFRGVPINSQSAAYTTVMADNGKTILHPTADNNARTFTIAANASVAYELGTTITFINQINTVTIAINSDTLVLAGAGTTGSRTLAANGIATAVKIASTTWIINGTGLT